MDDEVNSRERLFCPLHGAYTLYGTDDDEDHSWCRTAQIAAEQHREIQRLQADLVAMTQRAEAAVLRLRECDQDRRQLVEERDAHATAHKTAEQRAEALEVALARIFDQAYERTEGREYTEATYHAALDDVVRDLIPLERLDALATTGGAAAGGVTE